MNRRSFLSSLGIGIGALAIDPEQLIWTPKKTIFIPPVPKPIEKTITCYFGQYLEFRIGDIISFGDKTTPKYIITSVAQNEIGFKPYEPATWNESSITV